jgi:DNA-binding response OmpR family regulator
MSSPATILLIEGARPAASLAPVLESRGFNLSRASNSKEALNHLRADGPALVIIDCTTLHTDGMKICVDLRSAAEGLPIIVVTRPNHEVDQLDSVDAVLVRPFTPRKLVNRIHRLLPDGAGEILKVGDVTLNVDTHYLRVGKAEYHLTPMKTRLLEAFLRRPGEVLTREYLMKNVWKTDYVGDTRTIEVHVRWLRQLIEVDAAKPKLLQTVRGVGYRLVSGTNK